MQSESRGHFRHAKRKVDGIFCGAAERVSDYGLGEPRVCCGPADVTQNSCYAGRRRAFLPDFYQNAIY